MTDEELNKHFERLEHSMTNLEDSTTRLTVQESENGELYIVIPDGVLNQMGWDIPSQWDGISILFWSGIRVMTIHGTFKSTKRLSSIS